MGKTGAMDGPSSTRPTGLVEARKIVNDLFRPRPGIFWPDMLGSAAIGWTAFGMAIWSSPYEPAFFGWLLLSVAAMYRALLFIHELTHLSRGALPGFELVWNLLVGLPMLVPSLTYIGVHTDHHRRTVYGTPGDPEYLSLGCGPRWRVILFLVETALAPAAFFLRFVVLAPIGLLVPPLHRGLERRASSLVINMAYVRKDLTPDDRARMRWMEVGSLAIWGTAALFAVLHVLPVQAFFTWYLLSFGVAFVNQVRTLGAHRYRNDGAEMDVVGQVADSVTVPGGWWTGVWAPVGLRYHGLHHYLPDLPYHALGCAHRRLVDQLPADAPYRLAVARSLPEVLGTLWREAGAKGRLQDGPLGG